jgi:hypothetical protein
LKNLFPPFYPGGAEINFSKVNVEVTLSESYDIPSGAS